MGKKRRNKLLWVTATSVVGFACNDSRRTVGDVAPTPDFPTGKVGMVIHDAAPEPIGADASVSTLTDADAGATKAADAGAWPQKPPAQHILPTGKIAAPPDK